MPWVVGGGLWNGGWKEMKWKPWEERIGVSAPPSLRRTLSPQFNWNCLDKIKHKETMFRRNIILRSSNFMIGMVYFLFFYISSYAQFSGALIIISQNSSKSMEPEPSYKKTIMSSKTYFQKWSCSPTLQHHYLVQFLNDSFQLLISQGGEQFTWLEWENENCKQGMFVAPIRPLRVSVVMKPWPSLS